MLSKNIKFLTKLLKVPNSMPNTDKNNSLIFSIKKFGFMYQICSESLDDR